MSSAKRSKRASKRSSPPCKIAEACGLTAAEVRRLAGLICSLDQHREVVSQTIKLIDELQRGGIVTVVGEAALLRRLTERCASATQLFLAISTSEDEHKAGEALSELGGQVEDVEWELLRTVHDELKAKAQRQGEIIRPLMERLAKWRALIDGVKAALNEGLKARAPVFAEEPEVQRLDACVSAAERAVREQQFRLLIQSLEQLPSEQKAEELRESIRARTRETHKYSRQADLLMLRSPLEGRIHYTMLLGTASEPGTHGINIQDSSTLVEGDRSRMSGIIHRVTTAIDSGLARDFDLRKASAAPPNSAASAPHGGAPGVSEDELRRLRVGEPLAGPGQRHQLAALLQKMGDFMYRLFMPDWMQRYLHETPCAVMITTNDLELPWELMYCNGEFLCLQRPTSRMPMGRALPRHKPNADNLGARKLRFLLIHSDPEGTLPAAGVEIDTLHASLTGEWRERIDVVKLPRKEATGERLNEELASGTFDVIHYAGHAAFDDAAPELSGLLVSDAGGAKEIFFAQKIRRLTEGRPLVFLNACQSGRTANEDAPSRTDYLLEPAEGLASAFLYGGALACIGSLWPIYDKPAAEFALAFYRKALEGYMLGEAMRLARVEIKKQHPDQVTWAAFALYGDATFRLAS